jgi:uncharacterized protein YqhQ
MSKKKYSGIGGQAVMEGIMLRNGNRYAVAVRKKDGGIVVDVQDSVPFGEKHKWGKWPIVRGVVAFVESLVIGMKTLMWSSSFFEVEEDEKKKEKEEKKEKKSGLSGGETALTLVIAILLAVGIFIVLPTVVSNFLKRCIENAVLISLIEGVLRLGIFIAYISLISLMKDVRRTYMYHGSEHKCINCLESGMPLTVENVMKSSKEHKRCGTSFLLFVMLISIVVFIIVGIVLQSLGIDVLWVRLLTRILLIPLIAGLSYELIRFNGRFDNAFTYVLSRPGMWLQALTTKEPTDDMAEVAIQAVEAVFDWRTFLKESFDLDVPDVSEEQ